MSLQVDACGRRILTIIMLTCTGFALETYANERIKEKMPVAARENDPSPGPVADLTAPKELDLRQAYAAEIMKKVRANWMRRSNARIEDGVCRVLVRQIPGGQVIEAEIQPDCPYGDAARRSLEAAILLSQPLPYSGFEEVFSRTLILNFRAAH